MRKKREYSVPIREQMVPWLFLLPSLLFVSIMVLIPMLDALRRSFFLAASDRFVGFQNYLAVLKNHAFKLAAANTARFILVCIPLLLLFSLAVSLMLASFREKRGIFKTSFLVPMAVPVASIVLLWRVIFHKNGLLNAFTALWGLVPVDWIGSKAAFGVLVFAYLWKNFGYDMVLWLSGLSAINPALYEAAQIDGAGSLQRFVRITLPNLMPTLFTITVLSLLNSFKVFREAYLIAGGYPDDSIYMLQHLFNNWYGNLDVDKMCAGAVMMAILVFILILLLLTIVVAAVYIALSRPFIRLFNSNPAVIEYGSRLLISQVALYPAFGLCYMMTITFQTIGASRFGLFLSMIRQGLFYVPFILILPRLLGVTGIYFAQPAADVLTILICILSIRPMKQTASRNMKKTR